MISTCAACGAGPTGDIIEGREMMLGLRERFHYRRCCECHSLWIEDPPDDLARFYPSSYYSLNVEAPPASTWRRLRAGTALRLPPRLVERLVRLRGLRGTPLFARWLAGLGVKRTDKVGDIGSGAGAVLREMAACGFTDLWGFDPYLERNADVDGVHLRRTGIDGVPAGFDILLSNHTLEHLADPLGHLSAVRERLKPGAPFVVRVPLADSFAERTYGPDWLQLDPPRHLWIPSEQGMQVLAERARFHVERVFHDGLALALYGSELYRRDVPLDEFEAALSGERPALSAEDRAGFAHRADELNRRHDGDAAGFVLRP